ncbi:MAG: PepSY domain-containing protein [Caulobacterales bacterium]|nr:PepSY domain-containing protein [Caulobacterales bacterium]
MVSRAARSSGPAGERARSSARLWWAVHQWVGLKLSILLSFVLLTGTLAVFGHEIDWLMRPGMRVAPASAQGAMNWPAIAEAVARHAPEARIATVDAPLDRGFAARAAIVTADGGRRLLFAHPATGAVQGDYSWWSAQRILRNMHRHLFMPTAIGVPIVSSLSILLVVSLATSFVVYKKWWRGFFKPVRLRDARTAFGDVHRLAGVWSLWFLALMAATGLWYLAEAMGARAPAHPSADIPATELTTREAATALAAGLRSARAAFPELSVTRVVFPTTQSGAFVFQGDHEAVLVRPRSNAVWVSAATGQAVLVTDGAQLNVHQRISEMADPLHFGTFGGLWTKLIWFAFGAAMTALSLSGAAIYSLRLAKARREGPTVGRVIGEALSGMGVWRWPAAGLVLAGLALLAAALV